jgi:hypothetical protein
MVVMLHLFPLGLKYSDTLLYRECLLCHGVFVYIILTFPHCVWQPSYWSTRMRDHCYVKIVYLLRCPVSKHYKSKMYGIFNMKKNWNLRWGQNKLISGQINYAQPSTCNTMLPFLHTYVINHFLNSTVCSPCLYANALYREFITSMTEYFIN